MAEEQRDVNMAAWGGKQEAYDGRLNSKGGEKDWDRKDVLQVLVIKDRDGDDLKND